MPNSLIYRSWLETHRLPPINLLQPHTVQIAINSTVHTSLYSFVVSLARPTDVSSSFHYYQKSNPIPPKTNQIDLNELNKKIGKIKISIQLWYQEKQYNFFLNNRFDRTFVI